MRMLTPLLSAAGYWAYGSTVADNILFSLENPRGVISLASAMVLVHVLGSYQVCIQLRTLAF